MDLSSPTCMLNDEHLRGLIRGVVFDLDGTFIDSTPAIVESFMHTFDTLELPRPEEKVIVDSIGHILEDQFTALTDHDPAECVRVYREHYGQICCDKTTLLPGAVESVQRLRDAGLKVGFATSKKRHYAELILEHLGVLGYFESRIGPDEVSKPKPHPECLEKSSANLGLKNTEFFFIGDTDFDVKAAHAAKVRCLCVTTGYNTRQQLESLQPELVADHLDEITEYILRHSAA